MVLLLLAWQAGIEVPTALTAFFGPIWGADITGGWQIWLDIISAAAPLWLTALAFAIPSKAGFFNIGGQGQMLVGAFLGACAGIGADALLPDSTLGRLTAVTLVLAAAAAGGTFWIYLAWLLHAQSRARAVVITILLNLIAFETVNLALQLPVIASSVSQGAETKGFARARLHPLIDGTSAHLTALAPIILLLAVLGTLYLWYSLPGLRARAAGCSETVSAFAGINVGRARLIAVLLGGAAAGLAGTNLLANQGKFTVETFGTFGYTGISVAILGRERLSGILVASGFLALWQQASVVLQEDHIPHQIALVAPAICLLAYLWIGQRERR